MNLLTFVIAWALSFPLSFAIGSYYGENEYMIKKKLFGVNCALEEIEGSGLLAFREVCSDGPLRWVSQYDTTYQEYLDALAER